MNWLLFIFALEAGIVPNGSFLMYDRQPQVFCYEGEYYYPVSVEAATLAPTFYTDLSVEFELLEIFFFGGGVRIPMKWNGSGFSPHATYYDFQAGVRLGPVDFFWHHTCRHPQMTYAYDYLSDVGWESAYDEMGIKVTGEMPVFKRREGR